MMKKVLFLLIVIGMFCQPANGSAQAMPDGRWWRNPRVVEHLGLTGPEQERLDREYAASRRTLIELKKDVELARFELDNLLESAVMDEEGLLEKFGELEKARARLAMERFRFLLKVRRIVGLERFQQLKQEFRGRRSGRMHSAFRDRGPAGRPD